MYFCIFLLLLGDNPKLLYLLYSSNCSHFGRGGERVSFIRLISLAISFSFILSFALDLHPACSPDRMCAVLHRLDIQSIQTTGFYCDINPKEYFQFHSQPFVNLLCIIRFLQQINLTYEALLKYTHVHYGEN